MASTPPFDAERSSDGEADYTNGDWPRPRRRIFTLGRVLAVLAVLAAFGAAGYVAWLAYHEQPAPVIAVDVPLITAQQGPIKERPADPGGMQVPDQDKAVYDVLDGEIDEPVIEKLLPPPEEPIAKPAPPPAQVAEEAEGVAESAAGKPGDVAETVPSGEAESEAAGTEAGAEATSVEASESQPTEEPSGDEMATDEPEAESEEPAADIAAVEAQPTVTSPETVPAASEPEETPAAPSTAGTAAGASGQAPETAAAPVAAEAQPKPESTQPETPASKAPFGIQLASFRSEDSANAEWERLKRLMPELLGGHAPRIDRADLAEKGVYYRLRVPVGQKDAAEALCRDVQARGAGCIVVGF
ncbi:MAG: hypothetical protein CMM50_14820 [Rhodospirillaceae bacterium]|nr:hypothetical protein [Rhodospirillaceae bacterium]